MSPASRVREMQKPRAVFRRKVENLCRSCGRYYRVHLPEDFGIIAASFLETDPAGGIARPLQQHAPPDPSGG